MSEFDNGCELIGHRIAAATTKRQLVKATEDGVKYLKDARANGTISLATYLLNMNGIKLASWIHARVIRRA